jgi:hypothetical protein
LSPVRPGRLGVVVVVVAVAIGLGVSCNGFREDEIECEQAVVRLRDCCPDFNPTTVDCTYHESLDCSDSVVAREYPALSLEDSRCVQEKSCADLIASGVCDRARGAKQRAFAADGGAAATFAPRVCPR